MNAGAPILLVAALLALPASAQAPSQARIPTVTRLVKSFYELETNLAAKAAMNDTRALDAMLDPAFEMRRGDSAGVPVPREQWIRAARASQPVLPSVTQMAVHDFGGVAIVSFVEGAAKPARFIVDCWRREGAGWKLAVRYRSDISPATAGKSGVPGTLDKRY